MPARTGRQIVTSALRKLGALDPISDPEPEELNTGLEGAVMMLDAWRTERLTLGAMVRSVYSLAANTASYTIGSGGTFNQDWPESIERWSVIPDDGAADPLELPMGRPLSIAQYQAIRVKTLQASHPTQMFFDAAWSAGLGACKFYPVPNNADVDVVLYQRIPEITSLVANTTYNLRPGALAAIVYNLAVELSDDFEKPDNMDRIIQQAKDYKAMWKRSNIRPNQAAGRPEFAIGRHRRRGAPNIYTNS